MNAATTADPRTDAELVIAAREQEPGVYGELFRRWYDRCYDLALNILRDREAAADTAQDAFMAGWERLADLRDPQAFGSWILRTTRNRALSRLARDRRRSVEPMDAHREPKTALPDPDTDPAVLAERQDRRRLVWTAVTVLGERDSSLLDLHLRHGLEPSEIAEELRITSNNASQLLFRLRRKLKEAIGAVLLWREGRPRCDQLAALLPPESPFDVNIASTIRRHQRHCPRCLKEVLAQTDPERMFAAVPLAVAPLLLKERAASALVQAGAPMVAPAAVPASVPAAAPAPGADPSSGSGFASAGPAVRLAVIGAAVVVIAVVTAIGLQPMGPGHHGSLDAGPTAQLPVTTPTGSPGAGTKPPTTAPGTPPPGGSGSSSNSQGPTGSPPATTRPTSTRPRRTTAPPSGRPGPSRSGRPIGEWPDPRWCQPQPRFGYPSWPGYPGWPCWCPRPPWHRFDPGHCLPLPPRWRRR